MENQDPTHGNKVEIDLKATTMKALEYLLSLLKKIKKTP